MASDENSDIFRENVGDMIIEIEFYSPKAVRISKYYAHPEQVSNAKIDQEHIDQIGKENLEIILDPLKQRELISPTQEEEEDFIIIKTSQLRCIINKKGDKKEDKKGDKKEDKKEIKMGNIRIGKPNDPKADFLSEHQGKMVEHEIESSKKPFTIYQSYKISEEEGLFGLGQQQKKNLNWRGGSVHLDQHNTIISVPVLLSTEGYGIIWENLGESHFEENNNIMSFEATRGEAIRYWVIF